MSNWLYANQVPTKEWRNAMTIPRELKLATYKNSIVIISQPVKEIDNLNENTISLNNINIQKGFDLFSRTGKVAGQYILKLNANEIKSYSIVLSNNKNERVIIGYDKTVRQYYIDRSQSGNVDFNKDFGRKYTAPRLSDNKATQLTLVVDASSVELFADGGSTVMTGVFFPGKSFNKIYIQSGDGFVIKKLTYSPLKSIWQK
jgi:fructan beta-fructosidase